MHEPASNSSSTPDSPQRRVGIVSKNFDSAFHSRWVEAASNYLLVHGIQAVVESDLRRDELEAITLATQQAYDGLIIHADVLLDDELNEFMRQHHKVIMLNRHLPMYADRCVDVDNTLGGAIAAQALIAQGHKQIAMVRGPTNYVEVNQRSAGFKSELKANNLELKAELTGKFSNQCGENAMEEIHQNHPDVTAVFFQNDEMAVGGLNACQRLGLRVPDDLSIIGFDGIPICEYVSPKLTTVQLPMKQLGEHAANLICDLILDIKPDQRVGGFSYQPVLSERESVALPAGHGARKISLTQREKECLTWTAHGKTSWEISTILGVSESTATFHLRNVGTKLKANNRAHAVAKAISQGLIDFN